VLLVLLLELWEGEEEGEDCRQEASRRVAAVLAQKSSAPRASESEGLRLCCMLWRREQEGSEQEGRVSEGVSLQHYSLTHSLTHIISSSSTND
jgi:hypothetical protein